MFLTNIEKIKTRILSLVTFFLENLTLYEIRLKNIVEWGRLRTTIWRMRIACWPLMATNTHSSCVVFIVFPLPQW